MTHSLTAIRYSPPTSCRTDFTTLRADNPQERKAWLANWEAWPNREPFAHPAYVEAFLSSGEKAVCAVQTGRDSGVLFPMIIRSLDEQARVNRTAYKDAITPYGYGGAFVWGNVEPDSFWDPYDRWAMRENIVTLFARLSLFPETLLPFRGETLVARQNVVRSLDLDFESMLMEFDHKVRKNIKKAERSGVKIEVDLEGRRIEDFYETYISTMSRRHAETAYYFPLSFFQKLLEKCPRSLVFFHAIFEGKVISSEVVLVGEHHTYSFLGGTNEANFDLRPNDLLKVAIIDWSRNQGKRFFVLGGGYEPDDGIFRYKTSFAPNGGSRPFLIGKRIFDEMANEYLVEQRHRSDPNWQPSPGFFPIYRSPGGKNE